MNENGIISLIIIFANAAFSYTGFKNKVYFDQHKFEIDKILIQKEYSRLLSSGFLHVGWMHLILNMVSLYAFSELLEYHLGVQWFLLVYFGSLIGGNLLALYIHRHHGDYSAVGASGAVSGIVFASIALFPELEIGLIGLPYSIPSWLYGLLYIIYSIYGIKSKKDNIGHEAHLGGALVGLLIAISIQPAALSENYLTISILTIPTLTFIGLIIAKPHILIIDNFYFKNQTHYTIDHKYNHEKNNNQRELDRLLDKIHSKGIGSLTKKEKEKLDEYSNNLS